MRALVAAAALERGGRDEAGVLAQRRVHGLRGHAGVVRAVPRRLPHRALRAAQLEPVAAARLRAVRPGRDDPLKAQVGGRRRAWSSKSVASG